MYDSKVGKRALKMWLADALWSYLWLDCSRPGKSVVLKERRTNRPKGCFEVESNNAGKDVAWRGHHPRIFLPDCHRPSRFLRLGETHSLASLSVSLFSFIMPTVESFPSNVFPPPC